MSQALDVMVPDDGAGHDAPTEVLAALGDDELRFLIWGGDWCPDCTQQLPRFAAVLDDAGVPPERIEQYPVEKVDGEKVGPRMDEYGVEYIPTVIVTRVPPRGFAESSGERDDPRERDGVEVARFVESADVPIAECLARELGAVEE